MLRLLHLGPVQRDFQTQRALEHLTHDLGTQFSVTQITLGPGGDFQNVATALLNLRSQKGRWDAVHAWGLPALTASAFAGCPGIVFSPISPPARFAPAWLRILLDCARLQIVCNSITQQKAYIDQGAANDQCHVIRPPLDPSRVRSPINARLRAELGFSPDDFVVLAPGESTRLSAHSDALWAVGLLNALDPRHRLLIWGRGPEADSVSRFAAKLEAPNLLVRAEPALSRRVRFEELTSVADSALITARGSVPTLPIALCMAAGLPIVAPATKELQEILEDHRTALMPPRSTPRHFAQSLYELRKDPSLAKQLAQSARIRAAESFSLTKFLEDWQNLYQDVASAKSIPDLSMAGHLP